MKQRFSNICNSRMTGDCGGGVGLHECGVSVAYDPSVTRGARATFLIPRCTSRAGPLAGMVAPLHAEENFLFCWRFINVLKLKNLEIQAILEFPKA